MPVIYNYFFMNKDEMQVEANVNYLSGPENHNASKSSEISVIF